VRRLALLLFLGFLVVAGSGCGTAMNFLSGVGEGTESPELVYGGVQMDCQIAAEHLKDPPAQGTPLVLCALLDLPLSLLGDTLTLPLILWHRLRDLTADRPIAVPQPATPPPPIAASPATNRW
jgi:uncharacterized protein YceK